MLSCCFSCTATLSFTCYMFVMIFFGDLKCSILSVRICSLWTLYLYFLCVITIIALYCISKWKYFKWWCLHWDGMILRCNVRWPLYSCIIIKALPIFICKCSYILWLNLSSFAIKDVVVLVWFYREHKIRRMDW